MPRYTPLARRLRREQTDAERKLWHHLRGRRLGGYKFRRQMPIDNYIVDFLCEQAKLIVELDGGQHGEWMAEDAARTEALERYGYRLIRFWNGDALTNIDGVLVDIETALSVAAQTDEPGSLDRPAWRQLE